MDPIFLLEFIIVALIVALQFMVFFRNNKAIKGLGELLPDAQTLKIKYESLTDSETESGVTTPELNLIYNSPKFTNTFRQIVRITNAFLTKNQGAAELSTLQDLAEQKVHSRERAIESNITLPLYIGLLCTFTGVIIGLIKIAMVGVSDAAIQSFIGGVLIGMVGSASGLALTVRSNFLFKQSKEHVDKHLYDYLTFLRIHILPTEERKVQEPLSSLRKNLAAFNEGFAMYQQHMNQSLGETLRLFGDLKEVFNQIGTLEKGLIGMGHFLQTNDRLIEKQVSYIENYSQKAAALTEKLNWHFRHVDKQLDTLVEENVKALDLSTQAAYSRINQYLEEHQNGETEAFARTLNGNLSNIQGELANLQDKSINVNTRLLTQLEEDRRTNEELIEQIKLMNTRLGHVMSGQGRSFMHSKKFKLFMYSDIAALVIFIVGGMVYLIKTIAG